MIEWYSEKGYGTIKSSMGDYFFHKSNILSSDVVIKENDICLFNIIYSKQYNKQKAISVMFLNEKQNNKDIYFKIKTEIFNLKNANIDNDKIRKYESVIKNKMKSILHDIVIREYNKDFFWLDEYIIFLNYFTVIEIICNKLIDFKLLINRIFSTKDKSVQMIIFSDIFNKINIIDNLEIYNNIKFLLDKILSNRELYINELFDKSTEIFKRKFLRDYMKELIIVQNAINSFNKIEKISEIIDTLYFNYTPVFSLSELLNLTDGLTSLSILQKYSKIQVRKLHGCGYEYVYIYMNS